MRGMDPLFSVTITGVRDEEAIARTAGFLARVFKERGPDEIGRSLRRLPLLLTRDVDQLAAKTLLKHLEARGASVLVEPRLPEDGSETECVAPLAPAVEAGLVRKEPHSSVSETMYRKIRPGARERIFSR